jgi:hypothetical protein
MALALARKLRAAVFPRPSGGQLRFAEVFESWPDYTQRFVPPAACVLPGSWPYDAARMTPTLLEDTWEPHGDVGFGLYKTADISADFEINIRATSDAERAVLLAGLEDIWVADEVLMDHISGARYGVLIEMTEYWGVCAGFALKSARVVDNEDMAIRNHREAIITVTGQAPQVKLAPVRPLKLTVRIDSDC